MAYDLVIKNGRVIDGSGMPSFRGDVALKDGKIVEMGKLSGSATQTINAEGLVVAPGAIDIHCHYDAQVTWDPVCSFSPQHGSTTVIIGNCALGTAPVKPGSAHFERCLEFLSYVEAIPMEVLRTVDCTWETMPQYMDTLDQRLGVNMATLLAHSPLRYYVMGEESQTRTAKGDEIEAMQRIVHEAMTAGAIGLSISRQPGHVDARGVRIPALWANEEELMALGNVLGELGTGIIQVGGGRALELKDQLMSRLAEATGRPVIWQSLSQQSRRPDEWKNIMAAVDESASAGIRSYPLCNANRITSTFTMKNTQDFIGIPSWAPILMASDEEKLRAYSDPKVRQKLHTEAVEWNFEQSPEGVQLLPDWYDAMWVEETVLEKNKGLEGKFISEVAREQGKGIIDAFLDLVVEENLGTVIKSAGTNVDKAAVAKILNYPNTVLATSDAGAHVQYRSEGFPATNILGHWVRQENMMPLEMAVKRITFEAASFFGIYDRGLLRPAWLAT